MLKKVTNTASKVGKTAGLVGKLVFDNSVTVPLNHLKILGISAMGSFSVGDFLDNAALEIIDYTVEVEKDGIEKIAEVWANKPNDENSEEK